MIKDKLLHIALLSLIVVLAGTTLYFFLLLVNVEHAFSESFLSGLNIFNPERSIQQTAKEELPLPTAVRVPIFIYHSVGPHTVFETPLMNYYDVAPQSLKKQLQYLKDNNYVVIGLDYLADALIQTITLPPKSVVLTFDDGWKNQYQYALPLLKEYNDTATFFIFTDAIDRASFLTWREIKEMDNAGMTIGGHTRSHPYLAEIKDVNTLRREIIGGKRIIEEHLGRPINLFAYPFGYYNNQIIEVVKEAGYKAARSASKGVYHTADDLFKLKAVEVTDDFDEFVKNLEGGKPAPKASGM